MNSKQWQHFLSIAQLGSLQAAGRQLGLSRSTLSSSLAALEDELNAELFHRTGNRLHLTVLGQSLIPHGQSILRHEEQVRRLCLSQLQGQPLQLRLGRDDALPEAFWRQCFRDLQQQFPLLQLMVTVLASPELPSCLDNAQIDLAICLLPHPPPNLDAEQLGLITELLVCHPQHPLAEQRLIDDSDLALHQQISLAFLQQQGLQVWRPLTDRFLALGLYELMRDAVLDNMGWSRLPLPLIEQALTEGRLVVLPSQQHKQLTPYWLLQRQNGHDLLTQQLGQRIGQFIAQY